MSGSPKARQDGQPAFVLHSYPFRETSLVVEVYARNFGRLALVARGARRPKSSVRGVLLPFQPLLLSWFGTSELRTLHQAEWQGGQPQLTGRALICGFYLNELLLKLLPREDPYESLFSHYQDALLGLASPADQAAVLRGFERRLLQELGYGLVLDHDVETGAGIEAGGDYVYEPERGPVPARDSRGGNSVQLCGKTLLDMACDQYADPVTVSQSKALMRVLINHHLGDQTLHTRQLLKDLQQL